VYLRGCGLGILVLSLPFSAFSSGYVLVASGPGVIGLDLFLWNHGVKRTSWLLCIW
jgi:hypothetical protein